MTELGIVLLPVIFLVLLGLRFIYRSLCRNKTKRVSIRARNNYPMSVAHSPDYFGMEAYVPRDKEYMHNLLDKHIYLRSGSPVLNNLDLVVYNVVEYATYDEFLEKERQNINPIYRDPARRQELLGSKLTNDLIDQIGIIAIHYQTV